MKLELIKYNNANCLEATFIDEDIIIHCQAYSDIQVDLLKEDCLRFNVKLNKEQLALIKEVEDNIVLPSQEELDKIELKNKLDEAYSYLNKTDKKFLIGYKQKKDEDLVSIEKLRDEARDFIRANK